MGQGHIYHILGEVMQSAISIYYIKMKSFNTNKIIEEIKPGAKKKKKSFI